MNEIDELILIIGSLPSPNNKKNKLPRIPNNPPAMQKIFAPPFASF